MPSLIAFYTTARINLYYLYIYIYIYIYIRVYNSALNVTITPHVAALSLPVETTAAFLENYDRYVLDPTGVHNKINFVTGY